MKLEFFQQIFKKYSNINFYEKSIHLEPSCSMRTDMTKLTASFQTLQMCLKSTEYDFTLRH